MVLQSVSMRYVQGYYCSALCQYIQGHYFNAVLSQCGMYSGIIVLQSVKPISLLHCTLLGCCVKRVIIVKQCFSVRHVQVLYFTAICVYVVCTGSLFYYTLCHCSVYRFIILLQSVSVRYIEDHFCTETCVSAVFTGTLFFCSQCQCGVYRVNFTLHILVCYVRGIMLLQSVPLRYIRVIVLQALSVR